MNIDFICESSYFYCVLFDPSHLNYYSQAIIIDYSIPYSDRPIAEYSKGSHVDFIRCWERDEILLPTSFYVADFIYYLFWPFHHRGPCLIIFCFGMIERIPSIGALNYC